MPDSIFRVSRLAGALPVLLIGLSACSDRLPTEPSVAPPISPALSVSASDVNATPPGFIRVGVVRGATTVALGGTGDFRIIDKVTGTQLLAGSAGAADVTLESVPVVKTFYRLQVACTGNESFKDSWVTKVEDAGYEPYTEFVPAANCWRLRIGRLTKAQFDDTAFRDAWKAEVIAKGLSPSGGGWWTSFTESEGETRFKVVLGASTVLAQNPVRVEAVSGYVTIGGASYRGVGDVAIDSRGKLSGVNELPIEQYLYGVVPRELPPTVWNQLEAQKAQAVSARTYAVRGLGKRRIDGYDLRNDVFDQVYGGVRSEHPLSSQAVDETPAVVATYNGALIEALYSSTAGGFTADNEEAFRSDPVAYLRGVPDSEHGESFQNVPTVEVFKNARNAASLRAYRPSDHEYDWSRYYRWTVEWTPEEIRRSISDFAGKDVGEVLEINVLERGRSGRAVHIEYVTENGTFSQTRDRIRSSLKFVNASGGLSSLFSTLFFIEPVTDRQTGERLGYKAWGGGWGHGVGMSQTGAAGMAERGKTYTEILNHYYQGITLVQWTY